MGDNNLNAEGVVSSGSLMDGMFYSIRRDALS
jgi:hypothetical protein